MFPIHDASGRVIGFGGRVLDKGEPKYLNSPETPFFSKGRELYGLFQARPAIRAPARSSWSRATWTWSRLAQHGVEYAVATLGTATTPAHAQKLFRLTDTVVFCFDGDEAGRRAAWRALENTLARPGRRQAGEVPVPARRRGPGRLRPPPRQGSLREIVGRGHSVVGISAVGAVAAPPAGLRRGPRRAGQCCQAAPGRADRARAGNAAPPAPGRARRPGRTRHRSPWFRQRQPRPRPKRHRHAAHAPRRRSYAVWCSAFSSSRASRAPSRFQSLADRTRRARRYARWRHSASSPGRR